MCVVCWFVLPQVLTSLFLRTGGSSLPGNHVQIVGENRIQMQSDQHFFFFFLIQGEMHLRIPSQSYFLYCDMPRFIFLTGEKRVLFLIYIKCH
jgi:hypothetical protein